MFGLRISVLINLTIFTISVLTDSIESVEEELGRTSRPPKQRPFEHFSRRDHFIHLCELEHRMRYLQDESDNFVLKMIQRRAEALRDSLGAILGELQCPSKTLQRAEWQANFLLSLESETYTIGDHCLELDKAFGARDCTDFPEMFDFQREWCSNLIYNSNKKTPWLGPGDYIVDWLYLIVAESIINNLQEVKRV